MSVQTNTAPNPCKVLTETFRVSFPHLDKPHAMEEGGTPKFGLAMLFDKTSPGLEKLRAACKAAVAKKWGDKPPKGLRTPLRDGNEKDYDGYKDMIYVSASSTDQPGIVDQTKNALDPRKVYAGCFARATVVAFAYDKAGNKGVAFALHNVQFVKNGEPFGNKRQAEDDFTEIEGEDPNEPIVVGASKDGFEEPNF
jgi:hypothetical protein